MTPGEERLAAMLGVMPLRQVTVDAQQLQGHEMEPALFETRDHLANQTSLHAVGLDQNQGSFDAHRAQV